MMEYGKRSRAAWGLRLHMVANTWDRADPHALDPVGMQETVGTEG